MAGWMGRLPRACANRGGCKLERVDLTGLSDLVNNDDVRRALPGMSGDQRLQILSTCIWLRDGEQNAIFRAAGWANAYQAIVFDAAGGDEAFLRAALTYVLEMPGVTEVTFIAPAREAGARL